MEIPDRVVGELQTRAATISIAGSGDVIINASDKLKVSIAGSGDVQYSGDPEVQMSIGGSGSLRRSAGRG